MFDTAYIRSWVIVLRKLNRIDCRLASFELAAKTAQGGFVQTFLQAVLRDCVEIWIFLFYLKAASRQQIHASQTKLCFDY